MHVCNSCDGSGQNGTDKMVVDKMVLDKMVWTKWYRHNGTDKMVAIFWIVYNSSEFNTYLITKSHKSVINTQRKPNEVKLGAGLMKKLSCQWKRDWLIGDFIGTVLSLPFCPCHFVQYHFVHIQFCPYHFVRYHFVLEPMWFIFDFWLFYVYS